MIPTLTLQECLQNLQKSYQEFGAYPIPSLPEDFSQQLATNSVIYKLLKPLGKNSFKFSSSAEILYEEYKLKSSAFKETLAICAMTPTILRELTAKYFLGTTEPNHPPMMKFLKYKEFSPEVSRKLIEIAEENYKFCYKFGVKLTQIIQ